MGIAGIYLLLGLLLIAVVAVGSLVKRLPLTETMIYLAAGTALGPLGFALFRLDAQENSLLLERLSELAVIVALFTTGLKLRTPIWKSVWQVPVRLAFLSMAVTVALIAVVGVFLLHLPIGAAVLLGAVLAPTDPVLASDVQLEDPHDRDRLRFSLTGEAGMNDGTAFPFVMLGLGLLGVHEIGNWGWKWICVDVIWAVGAGLGIGALCGTWIGRLVLFLRRERKEGLGRDEFLALGLIALSYGAALIVHAYGFLSVFAAGLALRWIERKHSGERPPDKVTALGSAAKAEEVATDPETAPAHMAGTVLTINEQIERILEVALVITIGATLSHSHLRMDALWFLLLLFLVVRPVAVRIGLLGTKIPPAERRMISWFGIRGIGSLYYLTYAINHGVPTDLAWKLSSITLTTVAVSIVVHGITVTPLMARYQKRKKRSAKT